MGKDLYNDDNDILFSEGDHMTGKENATNYTRYFAYINSATFK